MNTNTDNNFKGVLGREGLFEDWNPVVIAELETKSKLLKNCTDDKDLYKRLAALQKNKEIFQ